MKASVDKKMLPGRFQKSAFIHLMLLEFYALSPSFSLITLHVHVLLQGTQLGKMKGVLHHIPGLANQRI